MPSRALSSGELPTDVAGEVTVAVSRQCCQRVGATCGVAHDALIVLSADQDTNCQPSAKAEMLEKQIGDELVAARLEAILAANESEPSAQLKHEALQVGHERVLEFGFSDPSLQAEKFQSSPVQRSDQLGSRMPTQPPPSGNPAARSPHKTAAT